MSPSVGKSYIDEYSMDSLLVVNYDDLKNKYLKLSSDGTVMYMNCTTYDGNITFVDENTGTKTFYGLENIFFKAPAETYLNDVRYSMEM